MFSRRSLRNVALAYGNTESARACRRGRTSTRRAQRTRAAPSRRRQSSWSDSSPRYWWSTDPDRGSRRESHRAPRAGSLIREAERVWTFLQAWVSDSNPHVRRLVSEGTRLRLPWAPRVAWLD